jgi:hypothetical protein
VYKISAYRDSEAEDFITTDDVLDVPSIGAAFIPKFNAVGAISSYTSYAWATGKTFHVNTADIDAANNKSNGKVRYYYGQVIGRSGKNVTLANYGTSPADILNVPSNVNVYQYDSRVAAKYSVSDYGDITAFDFTSGTPDDGDDPIGGLYVFAREYEGKVTDVVIYVL